MGAGWREVTGVHGLRHSQQSFSFCYKSGGNLHSSTGKEMCVVLCVGAAWENFVCLPAFAGHRGSEGNAPRTLPVPQLVNEIRYSHIHLNCLRFSSYITTSSSKSLHNANRNKTSCIAVKRVLRYRKEVLSGPGRTSFDIFAIRNSAVHNWLGRNVWIKELSHLTFSNLILGTDK